MINTPECRYLTNIGYLQVKLSDQELKPIRDEIAFIQNNFKKHEKINSELAGNIEHEYYLKETHEYLENILSPYIAIFENQFQVLAETNVLNKPLPVGMYPHPWVNFMKKHEFNPAHTHSGVYSFVIWIDIPFSMEDEVKQKYCKDTKRALPGHFEFIYTDALKGTSVFNIPADKTYNNTLLIFPSNLRHGVYPFATSDKYRISVSGNYTLMVP